MRWMAAVFVVGALLLVAPGCGGSNQKTSSAATDTVSTETTATTTTAETVTDTVAAETGTGTTSNGGTELTGACKNLAEVGRKFSEAMAAANAGGGSDLEATSKAFKAFANEVPDAVKNDFQTMAAAFAAYADALKGVDLKSGKAPTAEQVAKLTEATKALDQGKLKSASANISAWVKKNCSTP